MAFHCLLIEFTYKINSISSLLKTTLFTILFSLIAFCSFAQEQENARSVSINISAEVQSTIELITIQTLDFQNTDRQDNIVQINPVTSNRAGNMIARGNPGSEFRLNYLETRELTNIEGTGVIFFEYRVAGNTIDEQNSAEFLDQEARDLEFNDDGEFYIWVGGRVDLTNAEPGSYEGDFTIEIEYI